LRPAAEEEGFELSRRRRKDLVESSHQPQLIDKQPPHNAFRKKKIRHPFAAISASWGLGTLAESVLPVRCRINMLIGCLIADRVFSLGLSSATRLI
jgi:hypothetical protein